MFSPALTLHNVLYIPSFHVNFISVTKLASSNNCHLHFNADLCHIMQNHSMETIGIANLQRALHALDSAVTLPSSSCNSTVNNNSFELWHLRLGHVSDTGLQAISKRFPFIPCKNNVSL